MRSRDGLWFALFLAFWGAVLLMPRPFAEEGASGALTRVRYEDFLAPLFVLYLVLKRERVKATLSSWGLAFMAAWAVFAILVSAGNALARGYPISSAIAFAGKEVEYLLFAAGLAVFTMERWRWSLAAVVVPTLAMCAYALAQLVVGARGYYGLELPFERGLASPAEAGGVSAAIFVVAFAAAISWPRSTRWGLASRGSLVALAAVAGATAIFTLSRSNVLGTAAAIAAICTYAGIRSNYRARWAVAAALVIFATALALSFTPLGARLFVRFEHLPSELIYRVNTWRRLTDYQFVAGIHDPLGIILGLGLGSPSHLVPNSLGSFALGVDDQYVRRIFEVGLVGTSLWLGLLGVLAQRAWTAPSGAHRMFVRTGILGLIAVAAVAGIGIEWLQVARNSATFHALLGILIGFAIARSTPPPPRASGAPAESEDLPLVTIIIPCRNEEIFIARCLDSILENGYPMERLDLLVVDGGSHDRSREIIAAYALRFPFIRLLDNPPRIIPAALNIGIHHARGDFVLRVDAHSELEPGYILTGVGALQSSGVDGVGGVLRVAPRDAGPMSEAIVECHGNRFAGGSAFRFAQGAPRETDTIFNGIYRREAFDRTGGYDEAVARSEDMDFHGRLRDNGGRLLLHPGMRSRYFARTDYPSFLRHNYVNGQWAVLPWRETGRMTVAPRHLLPLLFVLGLVLGALVGLFVPFAKIVWCGVVAAYLLAGLAASLEVGFRRDNLPMVLPTWLAMTSLHLAYGAGSLRALAARPRPGPAPTTVAR